MASCGDNDVEMIDASSVAAAVVDGELKRAIANVIETSSGN